MAKQPISTITIQREMRASQHGFSTNVKVYVHRCARPSKRGKLSASKLSAYDTNPLVDENKKISPASVIRAKRAQLALVERAQKENAQ